MTPKLTLGMAVYDDFEGFWMTIQAFRMGHPELAGQIELVVVDNHFDSPHSTRCQDLVGGINGRTGNVLGYFTNVIYHPFTEFSSTAQTRNMVFQLASAPLVVVTDPHVLFPRIPLKRVRSSGFRIPDETVLDVSVSPFVLLLQFVETNPHKHGLIQGPFLMDNLEGVATHFDDVFRENMWGTWGFDHAADDPFGPPLTKFGQGLGFFACKRDIWMRIGGFNSEFRGFGGEECYIHEKFRLIGKSLNQLADWEPIILPFWRGVHRFGHTNGTPYPNILQDRIRNYLIGARELAELSPDPAFLDNLTDRMYQHFVLGKNEDGSIKEGQNIPVEVWNRLYGMTISYPRGKSKVTYILNERLTPTADVLTADRSGGFGSGRVENSTIESKKPVTMVLDDDRNGTIFDVNKFESIVQNICSEYTVSPDESLSIAATQLFTIPGLPATAEVSRATKLLEEYEDGTKALVAIGGFHLGNLLSNVLKEAARVSKRLLVIYAPVKEVTRPITEEQPVAFTGPLFAVKRLMKGDSRWSIIKSETIEDTGIMVLSCVDTDKPKKPSLFKMAQNFLVAMANHIQDGLHVVGTNEYTLRLAICSFCTNLTADKSCSLCGCPVDRKAKLNSADCPIGKWADPYFREQANSVLTQEMLMEMETLKTTTSTTTVSPDMYNNTPPPGMAHSGGCGCGAR